MEEKEEGGGGGWWRGSRSKKSVQVSTESVEGGVGGVQILEECDGRVGGRCGEMSKSSR